MKVLFIGGTGRLSKDIAKLAVEKGNEVWLLTRGSSARKLFVDDRYKMLYGNIRNVEECKKTLEGHHFDVIIDFLTFNLEQLKDTLSIIDGRFTQYIFVSTATVYSKKGEEVISEYTTEIGNKQWDYAYKKYQCEMYLKELFANESQSYYTVIRPYVTYGNTRIPYPIIPQDNSKEWTLVKRIIDNQYIPQFDEGKTITTLTHTRDFAVAAVGLFGNQAAKSEAYHITNSKEECWGNVLAALSEVLGKEIMVAELTQQQIYEAMPEYKGILLGDKGTNMRFCADKIKAAVDEFNCSISLFEGIKDMIEFYESNPSLKCIDYEWNGRVDRMCKKNGYAVTHPEFDSINDRISYFVGRYPGPGAIIKKAKRVAAKIFRK